MSAGGATGRRLDEIREVAGRHFPRFDLRLTQSPGHATEIAAAAAAEGFGLIVAVGGDGTANEVVNGLFEGERPRAPDTVFTAVPAGTGGDLIKTLKIPKDLDGAMRIAATGEDRRSDVLSVEVQGPEGGRVRRIGINVSGCGLTGDVVALANQSKKRLGGKATFLLSTVRAQLGYRPREAILEWVGADGLRGEWTGSLLVAFVANGQYCGGGMWVGKGGSMQDGLVELTILGPKSIVRQALESARMYDGTLASADGVLRVSVREVACRSLGGVPVRVDVDGEQPGVLPATFRVLPASLILRGRWD
jgi:diacylglycerol kinase family enzyme